MEGDGGADVSEFLLRIRELGDKRDKEDADRARQLEAEILAGREARRARRDERARSLSPQKDSPGGTPISLKSAVSRPETRDSDDTAERVDTGTNAALAKLTGKLTDATETTSSEAPLRRTPTLSWQRRPKSFHGSVYGGLPKLSPSSPNAGESTDSPEKSRAQITANLQSKEPTWFSQTRERAATSGALRKAEEERMESVSKMSLPGMSPSSGDSSIMQAEIPELQKASPRTAFDSLSTTRVARSGSLKSERFPPSDLARSPSIASNASGRFEVEDSRAAPLMSPSQERLSPDSRDRTPSPTKGVGGFVQSARLKREGSMHKRYGSRAESVSSGSGHSRSNSVFARGNEPVLLPTSRGSTPAPEDLSSEPEAEPVAKPIRGRSNTTSEGLTNRYSRRDSTPPASPGKTFEPKRWSPTKSSWLETALKKGTDNPQPPMAPAKPQPKPVELSPFGQPPVLPAKTPILYPNPIPSYESLKKANEKNAPETTGSYKRDDDTEKKLSAADKPAIYGLNRTNTLPSSTGSNRNSMIDLSAKPTSKPKEQINFRASLKPRPHSGKGDEKEELPFLNAMSRLKSTRTQNYRAPNELKDNILAGKANLNNTGGVQKAPKIDPLKESLLSAKGSLRHSDSPVKPTSSSFSPVEPRSKTPGPMEPRSKTPGPADMRPKTPGPVETRSKTPGPADMRPKTPGPVETRSKTPGPADMRPKTPGPVETRSKTPGPFEPRSKTPVELRSVFEKKTPSPVTEKKTPSPVTEKKVFPSVFDKKLPSSVLEKNLPSSALEKKVFAPVRIEPEKKRFSPSQIEPVKKGTLAERFNPNLLGLLSRGPPTAASGNAFRSSRGAEDASKSTGGSAQSAVPLNHITKGRVRGPKRRAPTKVDQPATEDSKPESTLTVDPVVCSPFPKPEKPKSPTPAKSPVLRNISASSLKENEKFSIEPATVQESAIKTPLPIKTPSANVLTREPSLSALKSSPVIVHDLVDSITSAGVSPIRLPKRDSDRKSLGISGFSGLSAPVSVMEPDDDEKPMPRLFSRSVSPLLPTPDISAAENDDTQLLSKFFTGPSSRANKIDFDIMSILASNPVVAAEKVKTTHFEVSDIDGYGRLTPIPKEQHHVFFDNCMYLCTHRFENAFGKNEAEVYLWSGSMVSESEIEDAQLFARKAARQEGGRLVQLKQGRENATFFHAIGGILVTRRGTRDNDSPIDSSFMLCGRNFFGGVAFDEVDLDASSLCSGFSYVLSRQGAAVYLWKGKGAMPDEVGVARLVGFEISGLGELVECLEGEEPESFWEALGGRFEVQSADYWNLRPSSKKYAARLFKVNLQMQSKVIEITPFCQDDLDPREIYVADAFFEFYIVIGSQSQSRREEFQAALQFTQEYALLATSVENRPFIPAGNVILGDAPKEFKALFRTWDDAKIPALWQPSGKPSLGLMGLPQAMEAMNV